MKEHAIVVVMANAGYAGASIYATDILISQEVFYGQKFGYVCSSLKGFQVEHGEMKSLV